MKRFSKKTATGLKNYVYALVDPVTEEIFYVGKGSGVNRPFEHLNLNGQGEESKKDQKIQEIKAAGSEPRVDILRYGLDDRTAKEVEASLIDAIGLHKLTNRVSGFRSDERGRLTAYQVQAKLGGKPLDVGKISEPCILFYRKDSYPEDQLHDATRQFWRLGKSRIEALDEDGGLHYKYALAMRGNFVLEVYEILAWFPAGTTVSSRDLNGDPQGCCEFVGGMALPEIRGKYKSKSLMKGGQPLNATQIGFRYLG